MNIIDRLLIELIRVEILLLPLSLRKTVIKTAFRDSEREEVDAGEQKDKKIWPQILNNRATNR